MLSRTVVTSVALGGLSSAFNLVKKSQDPPGPIRAPVVAHSRDAIAASWHEHKKRQTETNVENQDTGTVYTVDVGIGTPTQNITVVLDTGSETLWVNPDCSNLRSSQQSLCDENAPFDYTQSSTIEDLGAQGDLSYGSGEAVLEYVTDIVTLGSGSITGQVLGIALDSAGIPLGILGLSPPLTGEAEYPYVLDNMVDQELIPSRAFSLDLRDIDSPDGALIFGGVDTGKYIGELAKCPMLDTADTPNNTDRYWITMDYVGITDSNGDSGLLSNDEVTVFLDSGSTISTLPTSLFEAIGNAFSPLGAQYDESSGYYLISCDVMEQSGSVDFGFGDKVISVSYENFIWAPEGAGTCLLGMQASDGEGILGDSFLRAAYVVYDQDNRNLHLAQAASCGSNLVAISTGSNAVPSSTGDCTGSQATAASTSLSLGTAATVTSDVGGDATAKAPGPQGTGDTTSTGALCLTCSQTRSTATGTDSAGAKATHTKGAAVGGREGCSLGAAVGAAVLAAWIV